MNAFSDERVRRRLWIVLVCYETAIVSVILAAGANIAIVQGGTIAGAAPLIVIGLAESLRIPLAGWSTQLGLAGKALAALALLAIAVASFDGLALVFSIFIDNRLTNVLQAQHQVEIAQRAADTVASDTAAFVAEVREVDGEITALAASRPQPPTASNKTCTWKNQRVPCGPDTTAAAAYASAQKAYDARLANLEAKRAASQAKVDGARGRTAAPEVLAEARRKLDDELMLSPFHRLVASLYGVRPSDLTEEQFGKVKRFAIIGLAGTFATLVDAGQYRGSFAASQRTGRQAGARHPGDGRRQEKDSSQAHGDHQIPGSRHHPLGSVRSKVRTSDQARRRAG